MKYLARLTGCLVLALTLLITPPVWVDKLLAPWLPGSTAWGQGFFVILPGESGNGYFMDLARRIFGEAAAGLTIREIPGKPDENRNAQYIPGYQIISLINLSDLPMPTQAIILLHELGHLDQELTGQLFEMTRTELELEADLFAARWACRLGIDIDWERDFWSAALTPDGWVGFHPAPVYRVDAMEREWAAVGCSHVQGP